MTVAIRRINLDDPSGKTMLDYIDRERYTILPNTAGCYTAKEAVLTAQLARELLETDSIKLEVIGDAKTLYPDTRETLEAARAARERRLHGAAVHRRRSDRVQAARRRWAARR